MTTTRISIAILLLAATAATARPPEGDSSTLPSRELEAAGIEGEQTSPAPPAAAPTGVVVPAQLVALEGDAGGGSTLSSVNSPFTNGVGAVGFTGGLANGDGYVWFDSGITWLNSDHIGEFLSGGEPTMGVDDAGGFIYSPSVDGDDAVWTDAGLLLRQGTQAPGFPAGTVSTFNSRPTMNPTGRSWWVAGFNESGGATTEGRMLYTRSDSTPGNISVVLRSDDTIGGFMIARPSGVDFDYDFSEDGAQIGDSLDLDGDGSGDATVTDFNAANIIGPGLDLSDDGFLFVEVDLDPGSGPLEAIVRLEAPCEIFTDGFESGDTSAWSTTVP